MTAVTVLPESARDAEHPVGLVVDPLLEAIGLVFAAKVQEFMEDPDNNYPQPRWWDVAGVDPIMGSDSMEHGMVVTVAKPDDGTLHMIQVTYNVQYMGRTTPALLEALNDQRY
jgi:hypothetical protein